MTKHEGQESKLIGKGDLKIIAFNTKSDMYEWLLANHGTYPGMWIRMYKKASGIESVVWREAVEVCLCFGWIDGVANKYDEVSYLQRLTPRRMRSSWSKINCQTAERLITERKMHSAGLSEVEAAKADGRWAQAYDSPATMKIPEVFTTELQKYPTAYRQFSKLNKTQLYSIGYSLATAKRPETRERRTAKIIEKLERGEMI